VAGASSAPGPRYFDNHCHLDPATADEQVSAAHAAGVGAMITVGTSYARSVEAVAVAARFDRVWATVGVHPHDAADGMDGIEALVDQPKVVAIGEAGLDYHYEHSPRPAQRDVFARHIALAHRRGLPLVIHTRAAWEETFAILDREGVPERTVFHCFTGGPHEAAACVERGAYVSISGIVTFKNAEDVRAAVRDTPVERLLVETDSPYLAPVPHRGRPNEPALVGLVAAAVALQKDVDLVTLSEILWASSNAFYGISMA
jgi:TatD DNase family protein